MLKKFVLRLTMFYVVAGIAAVAFVPPLRERVESVPLRVETWWREQQPHELYVPPPSEHIAASGAPAPTAAPQSTTVPQPTRRPAVSVAPAPAEFKLANFKHDYQRWNNCGPTTVGMLLSHYGLSDTQLEIAPLLKPNPNDKNVSPNEMAAYIQDKPGMSAAVRVNGSLTALKQLIANGFPVIVETWFTPKPNDGMGHYRLLVGYNDAQSKFVALDSYNGPNVSLPYAEFDADWKAFNRLYLVAYTPQTADLLAAIIGDAWDDKAMWQQARANAQREIDANDSDAFAWFNLGGAQHALGDQAGAAAAFDRARKLGLPWRMLWYQFDIFETYLAVGRHQDVLDLSAANLKQAADLEESHYYRGRALQALGKTEEAIKAYREALRLNKNYSAAASALKALGTT